VEGKDRDSARELLAKARDALARKAKEERQAAELARLVADGARELESGRLPQAEKAFRDALALRPGSAEAEKGLEQVRTSRAMREKLLADYARALEDGRAALKASAYDDAARAFARALDAKPGDPDARAGRTEAAYRRAMDQGNRALRNQHPEAAQQAFAEALREKPGDAEARAGQQTAAKRARFEQLIAEARKALNGHRRLDAFQALLAARKLQPRSPVVRDLLARTEPGGLRQKVRAHEREPVPPLWNRRPDLPGGLAALLDRLLAKDPADRPASAGEVARQLQAIERGLGAEPEKPSTGWEDLTGAARS
jgi:tetratricopeptide (TPR) repeat protein